MSGNGVAHPNEPISIARCIAYWAAKAPDAAALTDEQATLSYAELDGVTNRLARVYADAGVGEGDYVTIAVPNGNGLLLAACAAWKIGAIPHPISYRMPAAERTAMLDLVKPRLIVGEYCDGDPAGTTHIGGDFKADPTISDAALPDRVSPHWKAISSGGSTGRPKIIVAKPPGLFDPRTPYRGTQLSGVQLVAGPLYHNAPFMLAVRGLFAGQHIVVMPRFDAERVLALIERYRVNYVMMVPTMMLRISRLPEDVRARYDMSSLETVIHCAAPCPAWLKREWIEWLGASVVQELYGGTEGCGATWIDGQEWLERPGSVGRAMTGYKIRVKTETGEDAAPGEIGDIYMMPEAGPATSYFYLGGTSHRDAQGWEWIGDMGHLDEDGYLFLADRRTDLIISGGANIYPAEVEAAIDAFEGVRTSVVIGLPDDDLGAVVHAIVEPADIDPDALMAHLNERLVRYKVPRSIELVAGPLRDEAGKARRAALRAERIQRKIG
uniref:Long-chain-fatty-acid--CoA ligase n=2 Tax=Sphingomonas sp. JE1 TaxID=1628059 RepID=A0A0D4ZZZ6_9SPHN|nr:Long-chain-fatty-acid--CoA ligase [Sphingomonas sp. JE1]